MSLNPGSLRKTGLLRRIVRWVCGIALILAGLVLSLPFVPGPGFLLVAFGIVVLLPESRWLQRQYVRLRRRYPRAFRAIEKRWRRRPGGGDGRSRRRAA